MQLKYKLPDGVYRLTVTLYYMHTVLTVIEVQDVFTRSDFKIIYIHV